MAAAGQRDFQMLSLRRLSCNASTTSSPIDIICFCNGGFKFKGCSSQNARNVLWNDSRVRKAEKAYVYDEFVRVEDQPKILYSRGFHRGNKQPLPEKIMVAVDVDEVLGNFVSALNQFIADRYSLNHSTSEYHVYEFFKIWNCSRDEANNRVHEFFKTPYFEKGILPIPGAQKTLKRLAEVCNLSIVTSRQNAIKDHTIEWIEKHYPGLFEEIHFGNHFALDGQSRPKSEICKSLGAKVLIDDNPRYAIECAEVGIKVLLFDYENSYPWCKTDYISQQHPLITKVHNWEEVEQQLNTLILS